MRPHLLNQRRALNKNIAILGDVKIQPTATEPLNGLEAFTGLESTIVGHTKLSFKTVATLGHKGAKQMSTSGACTVANYTDSRSGKSGEFHHSLSAILVEIDGPLFWLRHLNARESGELTDLDMRFTPKGAQKAAAPLALVLGDTHVRFTDPRVDAATFGKNGIVEALAPAAIVYHDLLDGYASNPHHKGNPFNALAKWRSDFNDVEAEVMDAVQFVAKRTPPKTRGYIISSNHNEFLIRWLQANDWRQDPANAEFYLRTALAVAERTKMGDGGAEYPDPFKYWVDQAGIENITCLGDNDSLQMAGIELGMHGNLGPNGARGSIKNLRRIGVKSIIGHSHSPGISEGAYQVGTSSRLRLEYNRGVSGWLHTHCALHADGKRQLLTIADGRWRL
ncbi:MAG: hypothetical protein M3O26_10640 [Pseudomonadota bacterium]|nr:hypothetical protein [Pseudomonadota bacterium]